MLCQLTGSQQNRSNLQFTLTVMCLPIRTNDRKLGGIEWKDSFCTLWWSCWAPSKLWWLHWTTTAVHFLLKVWIHHCHSNPKTLKTISVHELYLRTSFSSSEPAYLICLKHIKRFWAGCHYDLWNIAVFLLFSAFKFLIEYDFYTLFITNFWIFRLLFELKAFQITAEIQ